MKVLTVIPILAGIVLLAQFSGCSSLQNQTTQSPLQEEILHVQAEVLANPDNVESVRQLGILYYRSAEYDRAAQLLENAHQRQSDDPAAISYLAQTYERLNRFDDARAMVNNYFESPTPDSMYHDWMRGKIKLLDRVLRRRHLSQQYAIHNPGIDSSNSQGFRAVVFPMKYLGTDRKYFALRKGLVEAMINDLSQVPDLDVMTRFETRVLYAGSDPLMTHVLSAEAVSQIGAAAKATHIFRCSFNIWNDEQFVLDIGFWAEDDASLPENLTHVGNLREMFTIQSNAIISFAETIGVELSDSLRNEISNPPTQNINAFLIFSAGLEKEDAGKHQEALVFFEKALQLDPSFQACETKIEENHLLALAQEEPPETKLEPTFNTHSTEPPDSLHMF